MPRIYETLRKIRCVKTANGESYEYLLNLPKNWVEAVARELKLNKANYYLRIRYNGKLEAKPEAGSIIKIMKKGGRTH